MTSASGLIRFNSAKVRAANDVGTWDTGCSRAPLQTRTGTLHASVCARHDQGFYPGLPQSGVLRPATANPFHHITFFVHYKLYFVPH